MYDYFYLEIANVNNGLILIYKFSLMDAKLYCYRSKGFQTFNSPSSSLINYKLMYVYVLCVRYETCSLAMTKHLFNAHACVLPCGVKQISNGWQLAL